MKFVFLLFVSQGIVTEALDSRAYLEAHNEIRRNVTPTAANMKKLIWSDGLANFAKSWVSKCNQTTSGEFRFLGQNTALGFGELATDVLSFWEYGAADFHYYTPECSWYCAQYKQIVWADIEYVGCAGNYCPKGTLITCFYKPWDSMQRKKPYLSGRPCSQCLPGYTCENGLCKR